MIPAAARRSTLARTVESLKSAESEGMFQTLDAATSDFPERLSAPATIVDFHVLATRRRPRWGHPGPVGLADGDDVVLVLGTIPQFRFGERPSCLCFDEPGPRHSGSG